MPRRRKDFLNHAKCKMKNAGKQLNKKKEINNKINHNNHNSWARVRIKSGITLEIKEEITTSARNNGTNFHREMMVHEQIDSFRYYAALASEIGVEFIRQIQPSRLILRDQDVLKMLREPCGPKLVLYTSHSATNKVLISPAYFDMAAMKAFMARYPDIANRVALVHPLVLRRSLIARARTLLKEKAQSELKEKFPLYSANIVISGKQCFLLGLIATALCLYSVWYPDATIAVFHLIATLTFISCITLRVIAAYHTKPLISFNNDRIEPRSLPTYSVMVALYRESNVVPQLIKALSNLKWPKSKLEYKLICEEKDHETISALQSLNLGPCFEIVRVPDGQPRTKPRALAYALPLVSGDYVAVYDAEDIPHPLQLLEAWAKFHEADDRLACIQAPLDIQNSSKNLMTKLFGFEYLALFRGLMPVLAQRGLFIPLGGTSNHFRVSVLREHGNWDPYNVTEDADLALRLYRKGYNIEMISCPTYEDAPGDFYVWFKQRARWFKGWMQTSLVHNRSPVKLFKELSFKSCIISQILLVGMTISSLSYILIVFAIMAILYKISIYGRLDVFDKVITIVDLSSIITGFIAFICLGWRSCLAKNRNGLLGVVLFTPLYWLFMSGAAWYALWQLIRDPFHWNKTPHQPSEQATMPRWDSREIEFS